MLFPTADGKGVLPRTNAQTQAVSGPILKQPESNMASPYGETGVSVRTVRGYESRVYAENNR